MQQPGEASVEDILESIKKVISRDNRASSAEQRRQRETRGLADAPTRATPVTARDEDDVLDLAVSARFLDPVDDEPEAADTADESPLVTAEARSAMRESLAALAMLAEPPAQPQIVRSGETSLEGMVRELLRPALAQWLDAHLPALVEKMVAAEIARIVGKRG